MAQRRAPLPSDTSQLSFDQPDAENGQDRPGPLPPPAFDGSGGLYSPGRPAPNPVPTPTSGFDANAAYRQILGRDMDQGELATEGSNIEKYGINQFLSNLNERAKPATNPQASPNGSQGAVNPSGGEGGIRGALQNLWGGSQNQDIINARTSNARDIMERQRKSSMATNRAALADRGLLGSGPEISASNRLDERLGDQYANAVTDIFADESGNADQRMIEALSLSANMSMADAAQVIEQFKAETERQGMQGGLALGNAKAGQDYSLGLGNLGLGRDRLLMESDQGDLDRLIELIQQLQQGAQIGAGGYI